MVLWIVYGLSAVVAFWLLWGFTRWSGKARYFGGLIRVLYLVVMATPAHLSSVPDMVAPAIVVALFDFLQGFEDGAFDAALNLGIASFLALLLYSIVSLILFFVHFRNSD
tara:strand:- start:131 stop:460 length:330 start_codon:yes stop_codon:yes gene_type:complete